MTAALPIETTQPRAIGEVRLRVKERAGISGLADLRMSGSLRAVFPRQRGASVEAVMVNTAGGLTGGDRMQVALGLEPGAAAVVTTQAAERAYRSTQGTARVSVEMDVAEGASLTWLPQETIVFDGAAQSRRISARLVSDARLLLVEPMVMGRQAMGETVRLAAVIDRFDIRRDGHLILADATRWDGVIPTRLARGTGGGLAMATVILVAPGAEAQAAALRDMIPAPSGVSSPVDGLLYGRIVAADGYALRQVLCPVIERLSGTSIPKVWTL